MAEMTLEQVRSNMRDAMNSVLKDDTRRIVVDWYNAIDAAIKRREQDAARLDWMDAHPRLATIVIDGHPTGCYFYGVSGAVGLKLREIIDATMAEESGQ